MKLYVLIAVLVLGKLSLSAKEVPPALMVYGSGVEAFTAAIQGARSNVPTLWIMDTHRLVEELILKPIRIGTNEGLDGGIWMDLLMAAALSKETNDSLARMVKADINPTLMLNAIEGMIAKEPQLTVLRNDKIVSLTRNKRSWTVLLGSKKKYEVRAIVDASLSGELGDKISNSAFGLGDSMLRPTATLTPDQIRTTIAVGEYRDTSYSLLVKDVLAQNFQEIFRVRSLAPDPEDEQSIPLRAHVGQAVGALAAYCAFFKTTGDKVDVRKLQTELMAFGARLLPWKDVPQQDPNFSAVQKCYLATILEGRGSDRLLDRRDSVKVEDVKPIFNKLYSRSQLWFIDNTVDYFALKDLLSFLKFISFRGNEVEVQVEKDWTKKLRFEGEYDPGRTVNRYEFLTLVDRYADPYAKSVTVDGIIVR